MMMNRRDALKSTALIAAAWTMSPATFVARAQSASSGPYSLPPLPYAFDALEPHIDARTMEIHHDKHHAGYVNNLNKAVAGHPELARKPVAELVRNLQAVPEEIRTTVRNNAGGHFNHSLFWQMMRSKGGGEPKGQLGRAMDKAFGGYSGFQKQFAEAGGKVFGSGWAWLVRKPEGQLAIVTTPNQDNPVMTSPETIPLLGIDVWEHAYYLKYQNRRADYISAWFNTINWDFVNERFEKARS